MTCELMLTDLSISFFSSFFAFGVGVGWGREWEGGCFDLFSKTSTKIYKVINL